MSKRILLSAGGTGGHVFPAVAVAEKLRDAGYKPFFITDGRGKAMIPDSFSSTAIFAASPYGKTMIQRLKGLTKLALGAFQTLAMMIIARPKLVIGFGGYPAVAPVIVGKILGKPTMLHEQNAFFGRANHFLSKHCQEIDLSWAETKNLPEECKLKTVVTGMPVRQAFSKTSPYKPAQENDFHILIVGGSLGAAVFGETVPEAISRLPDDIRKSLFITHQVRKEQLEDVKKKYDAAGIRADLSPFISDMSTAMEKAHLVIGRAGASSVAELSAAGRPALLVPYPHAMDDHQTFNAQAAVNVKGSWLIPESEMSAGSLAGKIATLISSPEQLENAALNIKKMNKDNAADAICKRIIACVENQNLTAEHSGEQR